MEGISFISTEESYTSKCSFLDLEPMCSHSSYLGNRVNRGLFISSGCKKINADINGSLNILRKVVGDVSFGINSIEDYAVNPRRVYTPK